MHWQKRNLWKVGIIVVGMLLLFVCMVWLPSPAAGAYQKGTLATLVTGTTITVQVTPTEDATVTALNKEQLVQQVAGQQRTWDNWLWSNAATVLSSFLSTLVVVVGALFGFWQWRVSRKDIQNKESEDRRDAQDKELKDRQAEREKRAEEHFQAAVEGLSSERKEAKIGAAILLRTFLRPDYEPFYTQTFDLAVAHLCPTETPHPPEDPSTPLTLSTLRQALIAVFKEAFPLARNQNAGSPQSLDASYIQLDNAYLKGADLKLVWMPQALLRSVDLTYADLTEANLYQADLTGANLSGADLTHANLNQANLSDANLENAKLSRTDLNGANFSGTTLSGADLHEADLGGADLRGARGLFWSHLRGTTLSGADLRGAQLTQVDFSRTNLHGAKLCGANLSKANLSGINLRGNDLSRADLSGADLSGADLSEANLSGTEPEKAGSLEGTFLLWITGLTKEQLEACKAKGAIIDEDPDVSSSQSTVAPPPPEQSNHVQVPSTPSTPSAQGSVLTSVTERSNAPSSKPNSES